jgi:hypothetical protein
MIEFSSLSYFGLIPSDGYETLETSLFPFSTGLRLNPGISIASFS